MTHAHLPYARQSIDQADINAVTNVLKSDFLTQGPSTLVFEKAVADWCGARHGVAMSNGTGTLHCAAKALGLGHGDWMWTSPITFVASANAGRYCGAKIDFVDVSPGTVLMCPDRLAQKLELAEKHGTLPKIVIPVHFAGQSCDMPRIHALSQKYGFRILEDAAHALGGSYADQKIGNCHWSDAVSHSFHPVKIITTGEGGMITTNDEDLASRISLLRSHGVTRDEKKMRNTSHGPWYYEQIDLGYNYRMTDMQAALGTSQMTKLASFSLRRRELADLYHQELAGLPVRGLERDTRGVSGWHLYVIRLDLKEIQSSRRKIFEAMRAQHIGVNVHYIPIHLQPDFEQFGFQRGMFPEAERYYDECMTLPLFPTMSDGDVSFVRNMLSEAINS